MQQKVFIQSGTTNLSPFFYIIQHIVSGKLYAGYHCNKRYCNSEKFMTARGYQTSSKLVKELIENDGLDSFKILEIRKFNNSDDAHTYEIRFLKKVKAMKNPAFLNQNEGSKKFVTKYQTKETREKLTKSNMQRHQKMSPEQKTEISQKISHTMLEVHLNKSPEQKEKDSQSISLGLSNMTTEKREVMIKNQSNAQIKRQQNMSLEEKEQARQKTRSSMIGKPKSEQHRINLSIARQRNKDSLIGNKLYDKIGEKSRFFKEQPEDSLWIPRVK